MVRPSPSDLVAIDAPGTATQTGSGSNSYAVYGPFADPPPGGNFIQMDGNPTFENSFNQVINGLTAGVSYTLSFWQAAGQQQGFSGDTTEQWKVFLAAPGGSSRSIAAPLRARPASQVRSKRMIPLS